MKCQALLTDSPCLQVNRPVGCECSAASRHRAHGVSYCQVRRSSRHEEHHANVADTHPQAEESQRQQDEVLNAKQRCRVGARVVDAIDHGPVGQCQHLRHLVRSEDDAHVMPTPNGHGARVDGELALNAIARLDPQLIAIGRPERAAPVVVELVWRRSSTMRSWTACRVVTADLLLRSCPASRAIRALQPLADSR